MKVKYTYILILLLVAGIFISSFSFKEEIDVSKYKITASDWVYDVPNFNPKNNQHIYQNNNVLFLGKTYLGFKEAIGFKESQGNYFTINPYGYMGKYQFGKGTLEMIGIKHPKKDFLSNSKLQEKAFLAYTSKNKWILRRDIKRYAGKYIDGVKVTESGILAAAHLAGAGNVKKYLRSGGTVGFKDANGTSIRYYLKKFAGYDTSEIPALKKPIVL
jgi:hypothetical protein